MNNSNTGTNGWQWNIAVFCGSSTGTPDLYRRAAMAVGQSLAHRGGTLIYGGGAIGLMGVVADAVLLGGGDVTGVIPEFLATREIAHPGPVTLEVVNSMHTRKARMAELASGFVILPGGYGTFDELCEIVTWAQLGLHSKPIGLLNVAGYFDDWLSQVDKAISEGFCRPEHRQLFFVDDDPESLLDRLPRYQPPEVAKWLKPGQT